MKWVHIVKVPLCIDHWKGLIVFFEERRPCEKNCYQSGYRANAELFAPTPFGSLLMLLRGAWQWALF